MNFSKYTNSILFWSTSLRKQYHTGKHHYIWIQTKKISKTRYTFILVSIWLVSFGVFAYFFLRPKLVVLKYKNQNLTLCDQSIGGESSSYYHVFKVLCDSAIPIFLMIYFYWQVSKKMKKDEILNTFRLSELSHQRNRTALKTIRYLIALYAITVCLGRVLDLFFMNLAISWWEKAQSVLSVFYISNNILNIVVYMVIIKDFRKFLSGLLTCNRKERN